MATGAAALAVATASLLVSAAPAVADDVRDQSWHLEALKLSEVHEVTRGAGITVAVIDTGVDPDHPDLVGNVLPGFDLTDESNASQGHVDTNGHGTSVASLIAGHGHGPDGADGVLGIAPEAKILPFDFTADNGLFVPGGVALGIRRAVDAGADVICVAVVGPFEHGNESAIQYAAEHDVVVVAGVGNEPDPLVGEPAARPLALATTGHDQAGETITTVEGTPDRAIDISAPGADMRFAWSDNTYARGSGTSAATAIVAGTIALVRAAHPDASRDEQVERIVFTADDIGDPGADNVFGWGAVNVLEAVTGTPRRPDESATPTPSPEPEAVAAIPPDPGSDGGPGFLIAALVGVGLLVVAVVMLRRQLRRRTDPPPPSVSGT